MQKLIITGNGFDLQHQLPTSYIDFRNYLRREYEYTDYDVDLITFPETTFDYEGEETVLIDEVARVMDRLITNVDIAFNSDENWSKLEENLGYLDISDYFEYATDIYDKEGDLDLSQTGENLDYVTGAFPLIAIEFKALLYDWISQINTEGVKKIHAIDNLFSKNDIFLTFNYTTTLEDIYEINNVTHIHGLINTERKDKRKLSFGHNISKRNLYNSNQELFAGTNISNFHSSLYKNPKEILHYNQDFFDSISNIQNVITYGFSYSNVDKIYIEKIIETLNSNKVSWMICDKDEKKELEYHETLKKIGFVGEPLCFHSN